MTTLLDERPADRSGAAPRPGRIEALDGLRGVAVLVVVAFHLWPGVVPGGWLGVDIFFVLSGYLITGLLAHELASTRRVALGSFWARRARRLLPAALATIGVVALFAHWLLDPWRLSSLRGDAIASLAYVANWRFVATGHSYFAAGARSPLEHLLSLAIEEQFYVVWPLVLAVAWRVGRARPARVAGLTIALAALSALRMASLAGATGSRAYFGTDTRAQALLVGAALALALQGRAAAPTLVAALRRAGPIALAGLLVGVAVLHGQARWLYVGGFTAIAVAAALAIGAVVVGAAPALSKLLAHRALRAVGRVSYGLYLWHWPVIVLLTADRVGVGGARLDLIRIATFSGVTLLSHRLLERPILAWNASPRVVARRSGPAVAAIAVVVLLAGVGSTAPPRQLQAEAGSLQTIPTVAPPAAEATIETTATNAAAHPPTTGDRRAPPPSAAVPAVAPPVQVGVVGDSIGFTLAYYAGRVPGIRLSGGGTIGCGIIATPRCQHWDELWRVVAERAPDVVVVVLGAWEVVRQPTVDGTYRPGTDAGRTTVLDALEHGLSLLPARTRLAVLDVPCLQSFDGNGPVPDRLRSWINGVFDEFVARHADRAQIVPISQLVCPDGHMDAVVDGVHLRPEGRHFDDRSAPIVWRWLGPRIRALADPSALGGH